MFAAPSDLRGIRINECDIDPKGSERITDSTTNAASADYVDRETRRQGDRETNG
jgi:hypothetical protein